MAGQRSSELAAGGFTAFGDHLIATRWLRVVMQLVQRLVPEPGAARSATRPGR
jgi:hypothetical protein